MLSPTCVSNFLSKVNFNPEAYRGPWHHLFWGGPLFLLIPKESFWCKCNASLAPGMGNMWPLHLLLKQGLAPLCSCHSCYLQVSSGDSLAIYPVSIVISISKCKWEADCKHLTWSPPTSCLRKHNQEAGYKCLNWSPSISCLDVCEKLHSTHWMNKTLKPSWWSAFPYWLYCSKILRALVNHKSHG